MVGRWVVVLLVAWTALASAATPNLGFTMCAPGEQSWATCNDAFKLEVDDFLSSIPLANLPDDGTADKCLRSGGSGGDPAYEACSPVINVKDAPYLAMGDGTTDDTAAINAALSGGNRTVLVPAGSYKITGPLTLASGTILRGVGATWNGTTFSGSIIHMTGSVGYCGIQSATPATCSGGTGACDAAIGGAGRGAGCVCYSNGDCQSGTCAAGTSVRDVSIGDLGIRIGLDKSCGISLAGMAQADIGGERSLIVTDVSSATDTTGVRLSDINGTMSGYASVVRGIRFAGSSSSKRMQIGVRVMAQANANVIRDNRFQGDYLVGVQVDPEITSGQPPLFTRIEDNVFEGAVTEAISDTGKGTVIEHNYCEMTTTTNPCIHVYSGAVSAQVGYNFFTPSTLTQPVLIQSGSTVQLNWASNLTDTAKWTNQLGDFDIAWWPGQNRASSAASCTSTKAGWTYYDSTVKTECACDNYGGSYKWCPVGCDADGYNCPGSFVCSGSSSDCSSGSLTFANLGTPANGSVVYCSDCTKATPCAGSGNGALAKRLNGAWDCD